MKQPRVLVIEDNATNTELMVYLINAAGWTTLLAADGEEGLAQIERERPDLVLCDINIPRLDGFQVVARLKSDADLRRIPIVAVTALAMVGDRERAYAAGFDGYLAKPLVPETFMESLRQLIPGAVLSPAAGTPESVAPDQAVTHSGRDESMLIVDDRSENIDLCRSVLAPLLGDIYTASDVRSALRVLKEKRPDLILTDVLMPGQSGFDFLDAVRGDPDSADTKFVMISSVARSDFHVLLKARQSRPDAILFRPLEPAELVAAIGALLKQIDDLRRQA